MAKTLSVKDESLIAVADSIRKKTGKSEKLTFPAQFVSEIESITTGGGGSTPAVEIQPSDVNFFDYDGTLIASYTEEQAQALTELPTPPEHDGLVFQGWNYTLEEVIANADAADVGALYTTEDDATWLDIEIASESRKGMRLSFYQSKQAGVTVDWGDKNIEKSPAEASTITVSHEYSRAGCYRIKLLPDEDCEIELGSASGGLITSSASNMTVFRNQLKAVFIGDRINTLKQNVFAECCSLSTISINNNLQYITIGAFRGSGIKYLTIPPRLRYAQGSVFSSCGSLRGISLPVGLKELRSSLFTTSNLERVIVRHVTSVEDTVFMNAKNIKKIKFNEKVTSIKNNLFYGCSSLVEVTFPGDVTEMLSNAFYGCGSLKKIDFTHCTSVPTLKTTSAFNSCPSDLQILVPAALADEWKAATNWTTYANNIIGV